MKFLIGFCLLVAALQAKALVQVTLTGAEAVAKYKSLRALAESNPKALTDFLRFGDQPMIVLYNDGTAQVLCRLEMRGPEIVPSSGSTCIDLH